MASKITYWKCVDCSSMINDENMHEFDEDLEIELADGSTLPMLNAEFCYGCMSYNPQVVIAYA